MKEISTIFEIYKTKIEQYFTNSGRDWRTMYRAYVQQFFDQDQSGFAD